MKYMILVLSNEKSRAVWETLTDEQRMEFGRSHVTCREAMAANGELVISEGLTDVPLAKRVTVQDGRTMTTDGPFAEVKEYLAGFYLVECDSIERAVELAALVPDAQFNEVEVRPVFDMRMLDL